MSRPPVGTPGMHWLIRKRPARRVVQEGITEEKPGVAMRLGNDALRQAIDGTRARLRQRGVLEGKFPGLVRISEWEAVWETGRGYSN